MNEPLSITLMGGLEVQQGDRIITRFKSQKTGALLAYLAYHLHQMHSREILVDVFWPVSTLEAGRNSLSVALSTLRHQLEPPGTPSNAVLRADRYSIGLNPAAVSTDVTRFEAAINTVSKAQSPAEQTQRLSEAIDLYQGRLLPGFYEEWIIAAQELLAGLFFDTIHTLIGLMEANGDLSGALRYARRAVGMEPLREQAQQHFIRLLAASGQSGAALRQYKELERLLEEMGEEPSAPLRALARQIEKQSGFTLPLVLPSFSASPQPLVLPSTSAVAPGTPLTLTFLMTDIQGSTRLWERAGEIFQQALASHHALLRREFARYGGHEITEAGDSFVVAFPSAGQAVTCAMAAQQALREHAWSEATGSLQVRMALHTGDVEVREGDYHGLTLHRAARMLTTGHGGQILCSEVTASLVRRDLNEAARLVDMGVWRLRDVPTPERLFQVEYPGMSEQAFPPLAAEAGHAARLPLRFTRFFGRDGEIAHLVAILSPDPLLQASPAHLVTLTGSGGAGKTRLAIEVAERLLEPFAGAVWFVPLADITEARLIADTILDSLRLVRSAGREPLEQVVEALAKQPSLLVLDNFEQLVEGGATLVQALLARLPMLTILVTSRQLLGLSGEQEFVVPPLVTPNGGETAAQLSLYDSVQLFVDRAQTAMPHFQLTNSNAPAVAELCHRLEGIPLAIELAAARALVLTPGQMLKQLEQRFGFLVSRKRDAPERHRTLEAAIEWSYRLLTPELQGFFARISVFRGGWTPEAAAAVCEEPLALDYLAELRECSLILVDESPGNEEMRFRMLESLREYAQEQLSGEESASARAQHQAFYLKIAEEAKSHLHGPESAVWLNRLETEHDNLRIALNFQAAEARLRLVGAIWWFWYVRGYFSEGKAILTKVLTESLELGRTTARAAALHGAGILAQDTADLQTAQIRYTESLSIYRELGDRRGTVDSLNIQGFLALNQQEYLKARTFFEESLLLARELEDKWLIGNSLHGLGTVAHAEGEQAVARRLHEESLMLFREMGDQWAIAWSLRHLGNVALAQSDYSSVRAYYEESLTLFREVGNRIGIAYFLEAFASMIAAQKQTEGAVQLYGAADGLREILGSPLLSHERQEYNARLASIRASLETDIFAAAWEAGHAMTWEQAIAYVREEFV